jgi:hypothetical protein
VNVHYNGSEALTRQWVQRHPRSRRKRKTRRLGPHTQQQYQLWRRPEEEKDSTIGYRLWEWSQRDPREKQKHRAESLPLPPPCTQEHQYGGCTLQLMAGSTLGLGHPPKACSQLVDTRAVSDLGLSFLKLLRTFTPFSDVSFTNTPTAGNFSFI